MKIKEDILKLCINSKNGMIMRENVFKKIYPNEYGEISNMDFSNEFVFKQKLYHWLYDDFDLLLGICPTCGNRCKFLDINRGYSKHCSKKCAANSIVVKTKIADTNVLKYGNKCSLHGGKTIDKTKKTNIEKYGVEYPMQSEQVKTKSIKTCMEKFGVEHASQNEYIKEKVRNTNFKKYGVQHVFQSDIIKEKNKNSFLMRYGVENPSQLVEIKEKKKDTCMKKYGVENPFKCDAIKNNIKKMSLEKYGVEHPQQSNIVKERIKTTNFKKYGCKSPLGNKEIQAKSKKTCIEKYNVPYACMRHEARKYTNNSKPNKYFAMRLDENGINYEREFHLENHSFDFKIENVLVEINPTITHNSYLNVFGNEPLCVAYHLKKSEVAKTNGYVCINVWDWDDAEKIINMLKPKETLYARNLILKEVSKSECDEFLNSYHLQNTCKGQTIRYGLYKDDTLVQIMTFGKPRYNKNYEIELLRLCSHKDYKIVGGSEKIFKYILDKFNPESIISYCDNSKFNGEVYMKFGFSMNKKTEPSKHWYNIKTKQHITDNLLRQRGFDQLFGTDYGKYTSNEELMIQNGFLPVYDCGQMTFVYQID